MDPAAKPETKKARRGVYVALALTCALIVSAFVLYSSDTRSTSIAITYLGIANGYDANSNKVFGPTLVFSNRTDRLLEIYAPSIVILISPNDIETIPLIPDHTSRTLDPHTSDSVTLALANAHLNRGRWYAVCTISEQLSWISSFPRRIREFVHEPLVYLTPHGYSRTTVFDPRLVYFDDRTCQSEIYDPVSDPSSH